MAEMTSEDYAIEEADPVEPCDHGMIGMCAQCDAEWPYVRDEWDLYDMRLMRDA